MNTDPKNNEPVQGLQLHPEQTSPNTNPMRLYEVTVYRTDYLYTLIRVEAETEPEAKQKAQELADLQDDSAWDIAGRDSYTYEIKVIKKGARHE